MNNLIDGSTGGLEELTWQVFLQGLLHSSFQGWGIPSHRWYLLMTHSQLPHLTINTDNHGKPTRI